MVLIGRRSSIPLRIALAVVGMVVLEFCTLVGSYISTPFDLSCWLPRRMLVFLVLNLAVFLGVSDAFFEGGWKKSLRRAGRSCRNFFAHTWKVFAVGLALCVATTCLVFPFLHVWDARFGLVAATMYCTLQLLRTYEKDILASVEWGYLILAAGAGVLFCALMPAYVQISWDGTPHYTATQAISFVERAEYDGADQLMATGNAYNWTIGVVPESSDDFTLVSLDKRTIDKINEAIIDAARTRDVIQVGGTAKLEGDTYRYVWLVGRVPNACGLWLARLLHVDPVTRMLFGRITGYLFYMLVFFFAIRRLRRGKLIAVVVALIPTSLFLAANYSYDPFCICMIAYAFARFLGILQDPDTKMTSRDMAVICVSFFLGACIKAIMFPLGIAFLCVPKNKLAPDLSRRKLAVMVCVSMLLLVASFAAPFFISMDSKTDSRGGSDVSAPGQVGYVLGHPFAYAATLVRFLMGYLSPAQVSGALCFYSPYLYPDGSPFELLIASLDFLFVLYVAVADKAGFDESGSSQNWLSLSVWAGVAASIVLIATSMYVSITAVGSRTIEGVQTRYLLPFMLPVLVACCHVPLRYQGNRDRLTKTCMAVQGSVLALIFIFVFVVRFA